MLSIALFCLLFFVVVGCILLIALEPLYTVSRFVIVPCRRFYCGAVSASFFTTGYYWPESAIGVYSNQYQINVKPVMDDDISYP